MIAVSSRQPQQTRKSQSLNSVLEKSFKTSHETNRPEIMTKKDQNRNQW